MLKIMRFALSLIHTKISSKIKEIKSSMTVINEKTNILNIVKECFVAYGAGGCKTSLCKDVLFLDEEVRWA